MSKSNASLSDDKRKTIEEGLRGAALEGRVQCARAMAIAKSLGIPAHDVGQVADDLNIKIANCQLGCF